MSSKPSLAAVRDAPGAGVAEAERGLAEAKRKLDAGRGRVGLATAQRVDEVRDEADALARIARKRARRIRKRARKRLRAAPLRWRIGTIVGAGVASVAVIATLLPRGPLTSTGLFLRRRAGATVKQLTGAHK